MRTPRALVPLLLAALAAPAAGEEVDAFVAAEMQRQKIPGLSLAVVRDGEVVKAQGYGLANVELGVPARPETIYQSGSVGKQFTAALVMILVEDGKLSLDDRIGKHVAEAPETWRDITVRHLLTHTSGLSNALYDELDMRRDYSEDELVKEIAALPLDFAPGTRWSYSNPGYVMLGVLVRRVTGKFYGDLLRERVFAPLGMATARIIDEAAIVPNRAAGYRLVDGELKNQEWVSPVLNTTADGALYLTVLDLARWDAGLYTEKLLDRAALDLTWTPARLADGSPVPYGYGFGWMVGEVRGHRVVRHGGGWQGFATDIVRFVDKKLTVIVLTNLAQADPAAIANGVAALYDPELAPVEHTAVPIAPEAFDAYVGSYELRPHVRLVVFREDGKLWAQTGSGPRRELFAASASTFFTRDPDSELAFVKGPGGAVTHLVLRQSHLATEARKME